jgi:hypothetical protein
MSCMHLSYDSRGSTVRLQYWIAEAYDMPFLNTGLSNLKICNRYHNTSNVINLPPLAERRLPRESYDKCMHDIRFCNVYF